MNSITVKVNDLWSVLNLMKKEGMSQVNLTLCEADEEEPAFINFEAVSQNAPECCPYLASWAWVWGNGQPLAAGSVGTCVFAELPCPRPWCGLPTPSTHLLPQF